MQPSSRDEFYKEYKSNAALILTQLSESPFIATEGEGRTYIAAEMKFKVDDNEQYIKLTEGNETETLPLILVKARAGAGIVGKILEQVLSHDPHFRNRNLQVKTEAGEALAEPGWVKAKFYIHSHEEPEKLKKDLREHLSDLKSRITSLPLTSYTGPRR